MCSSRFQVCYEACFLRHIESLLVCANTALTSLLNACLIACLSVRAAGVCRESMGKLRHRWKKSTEVLATLKGQMLEAKEFDDAKFIVSP